MNNMPMITWYNRRSQGNRTLSNLLVRSHPSPIYGLELFRVPILRVAPQFRLFDKRGCVRRRGTMSHYGWSPIMPRRKCASNGYSLLRFKNWASTQRKEVEEAILSAYIVALPSMPTMSNKKA